MCDCDCLCWYIDRGGGGGIEFASSSWSSSSLLESTSAVASREKSSIDAASEGEVTVDGALVSLSCPSAAVNELSVGRFGVDRE